MNRRPVLPFTLNSLVTRAVAVAGAAMTAAVPSAQAHPGHGLVEAGLWHAVTSPDHALVAGAAGVVLWLAGRWAVRPAVGHWLRPAGMALVAAAVLLLGARA
ncbi:MAG: hypothetical protein RJA22_2051 [Verrucomicrobiota bacterium]|jgi:hypothetical protein